MKRRLVQGRVQVPWKPVSRNDARSCSFCSVVALGIVRHDLCPETVTPQDPPSDKGRPGKLGPVWKCPCAQAGHPDTGNPRKKVTEEE